MSNRRRMLMGQGSEKEYLGYPLIVQSKKDKQLKNYRIYGNTEKQPYAWNQLMDKRESVLTQSGNVTGTKYFTFHEANKYLILTKNSGDVSLINSQLFGLWLTDSSAARREYATFLDSSRTYSYFIGQLKGGYNPTKVSDGDLVKAMAQTFFTQEHVGSITIGDVMCFDLTAMGIADRVNSVEDFKAYLVSIGRMQSVADDIPYFEYDAGSTQYVIKSVGERRIGKNLFNPKAKCETVLSSYYGYYIDEKKNYTITIQLKEGKSVPNLYFGIAYKQSEGASNSAVWAINNGNIMQYNRGYQYSGQFVAALAVYPNKKENWDALCDAFDIQIEEGGVATDYEPYLGDHFALQMSSLKGYGCVDLGTLTYGGSTIGGGFRFNAKLPETYCGTHNEANFFCRVFHYSIKPISPTYEDKGLAVYQNSIYFYWENESDTSKIKQILSGIYFYYLLEDSTDKNGYENVDLGTLSWEYQIEYPRFRAVFSQGKRWANAGSNIANIKCNGYNETFMNGTQKNDMTIALGAKGYDFLYIHDSRYTDAAAFKAAMQGVILYYEPAPKREQYSVPLFRKSRNLWDDSKERENMIVELSSGGTRLFNGVKITDKVGTYYAKADSVSSNKGYYYLFIVNKETKIAVSPIAYFIAVGVSKYGSFEIRDGEELVIVNAFGNNYTILPSLEEFNIMICEGSSPIPYEPYGVRFPIQLHKVGDSADYVDLRRKTLVHRVAEVDLLSCTRMFESTSGWGAPNADGYAICYSNTQGLNFIQADNIICNIAPPTTYDKIYGAYVPLGISYGNSAVRGLCLRVPSSIATDYSSWIAYLNKLADGNYRAVAYAELAEPWEEPLEMDDTLPIFKGETIIEADAEIVPSNMYGKC